MTYGERVKFLRESYGIGREAFASIIGSKASYIGQVENSSKDANGKPKEFSKDREKEIIKKFRLSLDFFLSPTPSLGSEMLSHDEIVELLKLNMEDIEKIKITYDIIEDK